jgi:hypothetical protein
MPRLLEKQGMEMAAMRAVMVMIMERLKPNHSVMKPLRMRPRMEPTWVLLEMMVCQLAEMSMPPSGSGSSP